MRILFLGDIVGRGARDEIAARLPSLRKDYRLDAVIANAENAAAGFGITAQICHDLYAAGVDCITTGNHIWAQREIIHYIGGDPKLLRPINFPETTPGNGSYIIQTAPGHKILVTNVMTRLFMEALDDPFAAMDKLCKAHRLGVNVNAIIIDVHGEASSEKQALGYYCDGRSSLVVGTHTHVPTADARILPQGTGYQTDAGMCGCYESVIGMEAMMAVNRMVRKVPGERLRPAEGPVTLCGTMVDIDARTGLCTRIEPLQIGGKLPQFLPELA